MEKKKTWLSLTKGQVKMIAEYIRTMSLAFIIGGGIAPLLEPDKVTGNRVMMSIMTAILLLWIALAILKQSERIK